MLLHDCHYWCIKTRGTEVPIIDPGNLIICKISRRASFEIEKVHALEWQEDDSDNAFDNDSEGNYEQKMPKKKNRKFVAEEEQTVESEIKIQTKMVSNEWI